MKKAANDDSIVVAIATFSRAFKTSNIGGTPTITLSSYEDGERLIDALGYYQSALHPHRYPLDQGEDGWHKAWAFGWLFRWPSRIPPVPADGVG